MPTFSASSPCFRSAAAASSSQHADLPTLPTLHTLHTLHSLPTEALATGGEKWRLREGYVSEGAKLIVPIALLWMDGRFHIAPAWLSSRPE